MTWIQVSTKFPAGAAGGSFGPPPQTKSTPFFATRTARPLKLNEASEIENSKHHSIKEDGGSRIAEDRGRSLWMRRCPITAGIALAPAVTATATAIAGPWQSSRSGTVGSHPEVGRAESRPLRRRSRLLCPADGPKRGRA